MWYRLALLRHGTRIAIVLLVIVRASLVFAQEDVVIQSRAHYELGRAAHAAGNFAEACREFEAGYRLVSKPEFLINIGQCRRGLKEIREARESYAKFLRDAPNRHPRRREVQEIVAELDQEIAHLPPPPPPQPVVVEKPAPPVEVKPPPARPAPVVATQPVLDLKRTNSPPPKSGIRKYWWLIPVTVVVAAGVAVGLGLGLTANSCPAGTICVNGTGK